MRTPLYSQTFDCDVSCMVTYPTLWSGILLMYTMTHNSLFKEAFIVAFIHLCRVDIFAAKLYEIRTHARTHARTHTRTYTHICTHTYPLLKKIIWRVTELIIK